jgi:hypothetical protein
MTGKQINAAIAEACGWKAVCVEGDSGFYKGFDNGAELRPDLPDYCTDLNAMHEAEKLIYKHHWMWTAYYYAVGAGPFSLHVTARKKAEALLKVLGKWEEGE